MSDEAPAPPNESSPPPGRIAREDRVAALAFALRGVVVLALLAGGILGLEQLVLAYPDRLGPEIDGLPAERLVDLRATAGQVVFIGDSVIQTVATSDSDPRVLTSMLEQELDGASVRRISAAATAADLHAAWLRYLERLDVPPRTVIIAINPRSFSPHWVRNPGWDFTDQAAMIDHPLLARLASVLEWDWGRPSDAEYRATPVIVGGQVVGTVAGLDRPEVGLEVEGVAHGRYLVRYAADYSLGARVATLRALVDQGNRCRFPVVLYLTPIDMGAIRAHLAPDEVESVERNLSVLRAELARSRWPTVDASELIERTSFDHPDGDPHEHLRGPGRLTVARALAAALHSLHGFGWQ